MTPFRIQAELAALPVGALLAAYRQSGGTGSPTKSEVIRHLAGEVSAGRITIDGVRAGRPFSRPVTTGPIDSAPVSAPTSAPTSASASAPITVPAAVVSALEHLRNDLRAIQVTLNTTPQAHDIDARIGAAVSPVQETLTTLRAGSAALLARVERAEQGAEAVARALAQVKASPSDADQIRETVIRTAREALSPFVSQVAAEGRAEEVSAAIAGPTGRESALDVFGIDVRGRDGAPLMFATWDHPEAPPMDPVHIWTEPMVRALYLAESTGRNIWLGGPAGTGKTQTAQQYAARTGRMFRRFVFSRYSTADDFLGAVGIVAGSTQFQAGPILQAYTTPGAVCLLDEPGMGNPAALSTLNGLLEGAARIAYGDRVWLRGAGNLFIGADNSMGQGDSSGRFAGVQQQNVALMDRFAFLVPMQYLPRATEVAALMGHAGCSRVLAEHVIDAFVVARAKVESGDLIDPPTFRQAVGFAQACRVLPVADAWRITVASRQPAESQVALAALYAAHINESLIEGEA